MKQAVFIEGNRDGYHPTQCEHTMTVGDLIAFLQDFDEDARVFLRNDEGYTYGSINDYDINEGEYDKDTVEVWERHSRDMGIMTNKEIIARLQDMVDYLNGEGYSVTLKDLIEMLGDRVYNGDFF